MYMYIHVYVYTHISIHTHLYTHTARAVATPCTAAALKLRKYGGAYLYFGANHPPAIVVRTMRLYRWGGHSILSANALMLAGALW